MPTPLVVRRVQVERRRVAALLQEGKLQVAPRQMVRLPLRAARRNRNFGVICLMGRRAWPHGWALRCDGGGMGMWVVTRMMLFCYTLGQEGRKRFGGFTPDRALCGGA